MNKDNGLLTKGVIMIGLLATGVYGCRLFNEHIKIQREGNIILKTLIKHDNVSNQ